MVLNTSEKDKAADGFNCCDEVDAHPLLSTYMNPMSALSAAEQTEHCLLPFSAKSAKAKSSRSVSQTNASKSPVVKSHALCINSALQYESAMLRSETSYLHQRGSEDIDAHLHTYSVNCGDTSSGPSLSEACKQCNVVFSQKEHCDSMLVISTECQLSKVSVPVVSHRGNNLREINFKVGLGSGRWMKHHNSRKLGVSRELYLLMKNPFTCEWQQSAITKTRTRYGDKQQTANNSITTKLKAAHNLRGIASCRLDGILKHGNNKFTSVNKTLNCPRKLSNRKSHFDGVWSRQKQSKNGYQKTKIANCIGFENIAKPCLNNLSLLERSSLSAQQWDEVEIDHTSIVDEC